MENREDPEFSQAAAGVDAADASGAGRAAAPGGDRGEGFAEDLADDRADDRAEGRALGEAQRGTDGRSDAPHPGAPSLEEALGLGRSGAPGHADHSLRERISGALGGVFLGRGFRARGRRSGSERGGGFFSSTELWGWRGAWPMLIGVAIGAGAAAAPPVQRAVGDGIERMRAAMLSRPEFAIRKLEVVGMRRLSEETLRRAVLAGGPERSAFAFDYDGARRRIESLGWVERASVVLEAPNTLFIQIVERRPVAVWRRGETLTLVDPTGASIASASSRRAHPELPLLVGPGAQRATAEALDLARIAKAGGMDVAALTRVGKRRWDLELRGGPRLMLPEHAPQAALEKAVKLAQEAALLERGFEIVDLRLPFALTARPRPAG